MLLFYETIRIPIAVGLSVLVVMLIANILKSGGGIIKNFTSFVKDNFIMSIIIVAVGTFIFNELLKSLNNHIEGAAASREFWGTRETHTSHTPVGPRSSSPVAGRSPVVGRSFRGSKSPMFRQSPGGRRP